MKFLLHNSKLFFYALIIIKTLAKGKSYKFKPRLIGGMKEGKHSIVRFSIFLKKARRPYIYLKSLKF